MELADFIPHGIVVAFASIAGYVFKEHTTRDDARFQHIANDLHAIKARQTDISDKMGENHTEILKVLLQAEQQRTANESAAERRSE